jgi:hypothetical protein
VSVAPVSSDERRGVFADFAYRYSELGWPLIRATGKEPRDAGWQTTAPLEPGYAAGKWATWGERFNLGVVLGGGSLAVLEYDSESARERFGELLGGKLPETPVCRTGSGRLHVYFADPGDVQKAARDGLELRVGAHQCLVPPSIHPETDKPYEWLEGHAPWEVELAPLPDRVRAYFRETSSNGNGAAPVSAVIPKGERNVTLASLAGTMRRRGMTEPAILAALEVENETLGDPPLPRSEVAAIAHSIARYQPDAGAALNARADVELGEQLEGSSDAFRLVPVEWGSILAGPLPETTYLHRPYLPAGARVWAWGPAESGKSIWAAGTASALTRDGLVVVYVSQENPLEEEVRRFVRLRPEWSALRFFHDQGLDLASREHVDELLVVAEGAALVVLDTLTACWSGDEGDNAAIAGLDREVLGRIVKETGASVLVLDHTGHPQAFVRRKGVTGGRGASSKGQKADVVLDFRSIGQSEFTLEHAKNRFGGKKEPPRTYRVVDTEDEGLELLEVESSADAKAAELADELVEVIRAERMLTTKKLREAAKQLQAGVRLQEAAMELLENEEPARVRVGWEVIETERGGQRARVWRPCEGDA